VFFFFLNFFFPLGGGGGGGEVSSFFYPKYGSHMLIRKCLCLPTCFVRSNQVRNCKIIKEITDFV